jgi:hypothetical protein
LLSTSSKSHLVPEPSNSAISLVGDSQLRRTPYLSEHRIIWEDCTSRFTNYHSTSTFSRLIRAHPSRSVLHASTLKSSRPHMVLFPKGQRLTWTSP